MWWPLGQEGAETLHGPCGRCCTQDLPIEKLRGLGGKMGTALQERFGARTAGDLQAASMEQLGQVAGQDRAW